MSILLSFDKNVPAGELGVDDVFSPPLFPGVWRVAEIESRMTAGLRLYARLVTGGASPVGTEIAFWVSPTKMVARYSEVEVPAGSFLI